MVEGSSRPVSGFGYYSRFLNPLNLAQIFASWVWRSDPQVDRNAVELEAVETDGFLPVDESHEMFVDGPVLQETLCEVEIPLELLGSLCEAKSLQLLIAQSPEARASIAAYRALLCNDICFLGKSIALAYKKNERLENEQVNYALIGVKVKRQDNSISIVCQYRIETKDGPVISVYSYDLTDPHVPKSVFNLDLQRFPDAVL